MPVIYCIRIGFGARSGRASERASETNAQPRFKCICRRRCSRRPWLPLERRPTSQLSGFWRRVAPSSPTATRSRAASERVACDLSACRGEAGALVTHVNCSFGAAATAPASARRVHFQLDQAGQPAGRLPVWMASRPAGHMPPRLLLPNGAAAADAGQTRPASEGISELRLSRDHLSCRPSPQRQLGRFSFLSAAVASIARRSASLRACELELERN